MSADSIERSPGALEHVQTSPKHSSADNINQHLSFPAPSEPVVLVPSTSSTPQPRPVSKERLYVGNLHSSVDEYTLLQIFSKFGKIAKLDFLFHKAGPLKGKPRGYAFVEYSNKEDADKALAHANDKLLHGRKLVITYANQAPLDGTSGLGAGGKSRRAMSEVGKPTTLSLLKNAGAGRTSGGTASKIARMEAKLRQLEATGASALTSTAVGASSTPSLGPGHPSLPPRPVGAAAAIAESTLSRRAPTNAHDTSGMASHASHATSAGTRNRSRASQPISALPLVPPAAPSLGQKLAAPSSSASTSTPRPSLTKKAGLSGVRIVKVKNAGSVG